jgi:hypothetical protein
MRLLSKEEKDLCKIMLDGNNGYNCIQNIIDHKLNDILISVNKPKKEVEILFPVWTNDVSKLPTEKIQTRLNEVGLLILTTCNLISLLEKEGYIMVYQKANQVSDLSKFGQGIGNATGNVSHQFSDKKVSEILIDYIDKVIVTTEEFDRFCKKGFIARDEQRFKKQIGIAYTALAVALLAAFVNLGFNLWTKLSGGTTIKQEQFDTLKTFNKHMLNKLDTLNSSILRVVPKDTIKTIIVEKTK